MRPGRLIPTLLLALGSIPAIAQWAVVDQQLEGTAATATVARIRNPAAHTLEFYRDGGGAVRARFTLPPGLAGMAAGHCPTLQVDRLAPVNRSVNDAVCLSTIRWAEYIVGQVVDQRIQSERLLQIMNGNLLTFRFRMEGGDYRDTEFSLAGSKRSLTAAIGVNVAVTAR